MISHLKIARGYDRAGCVGTWALQQKKKTNQWMRNTNVQQCCSGLRVHMLCW